MPDIKREVEHICANCEFYNLRRGGGPYCDMQGAYFKNAFEWAKDPSITPAGKRTCDFWTEKISEY